MSKGKKKQYQLGDIRQFNPNFKGMLLPTNSVVNLLVNGSENKNKELLYALVKYVFLNEEPEFKDKSSNYAWTALKNEQDRLTAKYRNKQESTLAPKAKIVDKKYSSNEDEIDNLFDNSTSFEYTTITNKPEGGYFEKWNKIR